MNETAINAINKFSWMKNHVKHVDQLHCFLVHDTINSQNDLIICFILRVSLQSSSIIVDIYIP